jgi:hypothetical protein
MKSLNEELEQARVSFSHNAHSAQQKAAREELLTKEFFSSFKSRTNNGDIAELYTTATWEAPEHDLASTTGNDASVIRELRKYYVWLYCEKPTINEASFKARRERPLQQRDIEFMERPVTLHECRQAIHRPGHAKAAGPDGLPAEFHISFEKLVVQNFHKTILEAHTSGAISPHHERKGHHPTIQEMGLHRPTKLQTHHSPSSGL